MTLRTTLMLFAAIGWLLVGCMTMAPGASDVVVTHETTYVTNCKALGAIHSIPPNILPGDDLKQLRNDSVALGGDTVLITGPRLFSTPGIAYRCRRG